MSLLLAGGPEVERRWQVVVVGSGLAGLSCAQRLVEKGADVCLLTPGYLGRDGATARVHHLAPWIVLNAPCARGDTPDHYYQDLQRAGEGYQRPGLAEVLAKESGKVAKDLQALLRLRPLDEEPLLLPGNSRPRARRFLPEGPGLLLKPLLDVLDGNIRGCQQALVVGMERAGERVCGVWAFHRRENCLRRHGADAVVLACGGVGAVFGPSTVPRWCRGSGLALAELASALLHYPHLTQALPVLALPPVFFPTTAALLRGRIEVGQELLPPAADLPSLTHSLAEALRQGHKAWLSLRDGDQSVLPAWVQDLLGWAKAGRLPLTVAVHHGMGGVAVDAWGRTSAPGLYACGEAAGGVQGRQRLFGTGLLEARIFALRAAEAVMRDLPKLGPAPQEGAPSLLPLPLDGRQLEAHLDQWMGPLAVIRPTEEAEQVLRHLQSWPAGREGDGSQWLTALRWQAAQVILASQLQGEAGGGKEEAYELARGKSL